jgi:phosphomannomutase/phosphoglucomutase
MLNSDIFREYDIRGIAERDLTTPVVEALGRAFAEYIRPKGISSVAVGYDARLSSPRLRDALIQGLSASGMAVTDLGLCPTPVLYFSLYHLHVGAGVMITGSHNPSEFNGFKLCVGKDTIYGEEIQKIRRILEEAGKKAHSSLLIAQETQNHEPSATSHQPRATNHAILPDYINYLKSRFQDHRDIPLKVVLDAGNGTAGLAAPEILRYMGCDVTELFSEPDGAFPNHHPDPTIPENLTVLIDTVRAQKADAGIAFDGDADRIGVVDEQGNILWGDQLMVIFARDILMHQPGATFVSEVKCSQTMYDDIRAHGGNAIMWKTGHSLIKAKMKEVGAAMAGEMSGHLFFADRYFGYDDAIYAACRLVEILKKIKAKAAHSSLLVAHEGKSREPKTISHQLRANSLSSLLSDLPKVYNTPEIRIDCPDTIKFKAVEKVKEVFMNGGNLPLKPREVITVDGVRAIFDKGWGLIRASNTQPVLVMRFEATDPVSLGAIKDVMNENLKKILTDLKVDELARSQELPPPIESFEGRLHAQKAQKVRP